MTRKRTIAYFIFTIAVLYIISPWTLEKTLLLNELFSVIGLTLFLYKKCRLPRTAINSCFLMILCVGVMHAVISLFRMDSIYYYLRNTVIVYSMFTFFIGYYLLKYLSGFMAMMRPLLRWFIGVLLFIPLSRWIFERFGVSMLFPALFRRPGKWIPLVLVIMNTIYGFTYDSLTALVISAFYLLLFISPGYRFFKQAMIICLLSFTLLFIYLVPNLSLIGRHYSYYSDRAILEVRNSNPILAVDANNTWRMVLWKEIIVDRFPANIFGLGFGTPAIPYFPVEDYSKLSSLPYVLGAHNSYIYLFGRLGILYVLLVIPLYAFVFKEYFYHKVYYYNNSRILIFWSFFAISVIAGFNPTLETPIFSGAYWLILGLLASSVRQRIVDAETSQQTVPSL